MKSKKLWFIITCLSLATFSSHAQTTTEQTNGRYFANEFTFDAFGSYTKHFRRFEDLDHSWRHGDFGGGVGLNYFFLRYLGIGADTYFQEKGEFWSNVSGSLIARLPIGNSGFAPYIFGGGGRRFDPLDEWIYGGGIGLEYRFTRHIGLFIDSRYVWADKDTDYTLSRAGLRFAF